MVESLISEEAWAHALKDVPEWDVPFESMLSISPHPDDETLGAGGLISSMCAKNVDVFVAAVTDGEHAYTADLNAESIALGRLRSDEQRRAVSRLGVESDRVIRLKLPDSAVASQQKELVDLLFEVITSNGIQHIVAPWRGDFHPDHYACGVASEELARLTHTRLTSYFFWTWHQGAIATVLDLPLKKLSLSPVLLQAKLEALAFHRSQLEREFGEPILPQSLLAPAGRPYEMFLVAE